MTQISTLVSTACFSWKTERPFNDITRRSCNFSFLGDEWWFELKRSFYQTKYAVTVTLKKETKKELGSNYDINVLTALKINDILILQGSAEYSKKINFHGFTEADIWFTYECDLITYHPSSFNYGAWEIICAFEGKPTSFFFTVSEKKNSKKDSSMQVDVNDLTTAAEKSTQVSRDFSEMKELSDDFSKLLLSPLYSDAKLRIGNRSVPVHRSVLSTRSQVFKTMFWNKNLDIFEVKDVNDKTFDLLLKYVYTGTVIHELSDGTALDLYVAGQKYGMDSLTKICSVWMIEHLTEENCISFLAVANSSGDGILKEAVISFIFDHPDVFDSPHWNGFAKDDQSLAYELIHMYTTRSRKLR